ncbi:MAG TPA: ABC transporter substrate-binding protein [Candidatus Saccharimonadia bacterium]|nr:ABC transporter substrate-binding protein [Candidatus Saccharimonadia bacterium]
MNYINRHIWGKWHQLGIVRRFLLLWLTVLVVGFVGLTQQIDALSRAAQIAVPAPGGTYSEAAVGTVNVLNPVLPESTLSSDINRLIFSGLTRYNAKRQIVPDLAERWDISPDGRTYTFYLRHGVAWQDGVPFTAADVAFTLTAIQNPDSRSPLASSWQGVRTDVRGNDVVVFTLPTPLASFMDSTTLGIVPRHLLESVDPSQLREASFNQHPVGTGPFKIKTFAPAAHEVTLAANNDYYGGRPKLDEFTFRLYDTSLAALNAYAQHQVVSPGQVQPDDVGRRNQLAGLDDYNFTLPDETVLFFQTANGLLTDKGLRGILSRSIDRDQVLNSATGGQGIALTQPILPGQIGYTPKYASAALDAAAARQALDAAGWIAPKPGAPRQKDGQPLNFKLVTLSGGELERAAGEIKRQLTAIGVSVQVVAVDSTMLQQTYMRPRNFQMLLFGINLGGDPDVYSFWHSSQAQDPGINLSGYTSADADKALETARIKTDPQIRQGKYDAFLKAWNADAPAAVLYESGYQYSVSQDVAGLTAGRLVVPSDRFYDVQNWTVRRRWVNVR